MIGKAKIKHRSLKSKPGANKKKELLVAQERDRFNKNMAQMMTLPESHNGTGRGGEEIITHGNTEKRWAAIRGFVQENMERRPHPAAVISAK